MFASYIFVIHTVALLIDLSATFCFISQKDTVAYSLLKLSKGCLLAVCEMENLHPASNHYLHPASNQYVHPVCNQYLHPASNHYFVSVWLITRFKVFILA